MCRRFAQEGAQQGVSCSYLCVDSMTVLVALFGFAQSRPDPLSIQICWVVGGLFQMSWSFPSPSYYWDNPEELEQILASILLEYNDRPHQGEGLDGLSPNELDRRLREVKAKAEQEKCAA